MDIGHNFKSVAGLDDRFIFKKILITFKTIKMHLKSHLLIKIRINASRDPPISFQELGVSHLTIVFSDGSGLGTIQPFID